jgi:hypothetical protein
MTRNIANVKEKAMADKKYVLRILALALVFGFLVAGCNDGITWKNVTEMSQVKGIWKAVLSSEVEGGDIDPAYEDVDVVQKTVVEITVTVDTDAKLVFKSTATYSGDDLSLEHFYYDDVDSKWRTPWDEIRAGIFGDYSTTSIGDSDNGVKADNATHVITTNMNTGDVAVTAADFATALVSSDGNMVMVDPDDIISSITGGTAVFKLGPVVFVKQ